MSDQPSPIFHLWAFGDAHVGTDLRHKRESLADALRQSEFGGKDGGPPFPWEIAIDVGDMSGGQNVPQDDEGREVVRQLGVLKKHRREDIYSICGNHDRSGLNEPDAWWWQKWVDPIGENRECSGLNPELRPYPVEGTWERYSFRVGNILFLLMSDRNEPGAAIGRGTLGGNPGGCVRGETVQWWKHMVESHPDWNILCAHHYVLKDTTVASGEWEGIRGQPDENGAKMPRYHGYFPNGGHPKGTSYLYLVDSIRDAQVFERYLQEHPGCIDMWFGGHTHTHPDDTYGNKSHIETKWGAHFLNVSALTRYHGREFSVPMSRHLTFTEGSDQVRVRCYMHTSEFLPQGWYDQAERTLKLRHPFSRTPPSVR